MSAKLGFVGLGVMGGPMAGHLVKAGNDVTVWNRSREKAEPLRAEGAKVADSMADLGSSCDIVFLCVSRSEDVQECVGELSRRAKPGTLFVDHSTIAPAVAHRLHDELRDKGFRFVDAPLTGGSMGAQKGQLTIFCGGEPVDVEQAIEVMKPYTKRAARVGGPGAGQMMKMANQIAVGGALLGLCECLSFAKKAGLDVEQAHELIGSGAGGSWAFDNYGRKVLTGDWTPGFTVKNQRKDFGYCREAAKEIDAATPGTDLVDSLLSQVQEDWTTAALYEAMLEMGAAD